MTRRERKSEQPTALKMLTITHETVTKREFDGEITALFNPTQLRYDMQTEWSAIPTAGVSLEGSEIPLNFQSAPPSTLAVELFFDTYEGARSDGDGGLLDGLRAALVPDNPFESGRPSGSDVTLHTARVEALTRFNPALERPPFCLLSWGNNAELFRGVLKQLHQDLTFFLPNGTPVRATLSCTFMGYRTKRSAAKTLLAASADIAKQIVVRRGDTLSSIAGQILNDPARWREIAKENTIDNPRALVPGRALVIPRRRG
jgi:hypothetical protein